MSDSKVSFLVEAGWLARHRHEVLLLDASIDRNVDDRGETVFLQGDRVFGQAHIPGARFVDLVAAFSDPEAPFPFTRPTASHLQAAARALGISADTHVVVYDSLTGAWAARVWWLLRSFGLDTVRVLNGGLDAWRRHGLPIESGRPPIPTPGNFVARDRSGFFTPHHDVKRIAATQDADAVLVCALRRSAYSGKGSSDPRAGHIPGSLCLPYPDVLDAEGRIDTAAAQAQWMALDLDPSVHAVLYCGGGINAAGLALALAEAGYDQISIYDGSLSEWRADATLPIVRGNALSFIEVPGDANL